jgi:hypothetical protein
VEVLDTTVRGATSQARVRVVDRAPGQQDSINVNRQYGGGIPVSYRSLERIEQ